MRTVYVVGAGVEVPLGLPLANGLMAELAAFVAGDGKQLARTLRDKLGRFQFSFDRLAQDQSEVFAERLLANQSSIANSILGALAKHPDPNSPAISAVRDVVQ